MPPHFNAIDLHTHTTASDGSFNPSDLVRAAKNVGLDAIAITDHDTIGGLEEATRTANTLGIELVTGVELSVEDDEGRFHLLGYLFDPNDVTLTTTLVTLRKSRAARNELMGTKLAELGLSITMDDVRAEAGNSDVIARPHFAQAMLKKQIVSSVKEAFDRYLASDKPLYLPKEVLTPAQAVGLIHDAGGLAVIAHPGLIPMREEKLSARIETLILRDGIDGIEAHYSQHSPAETERFVSLARRAGAIVTAGSDFHGTPKPHVSLGGVASGRPAPYTILENMRTRLKDRG